MEKILKQYISDECKKHIQRHYEYLLELEENIVRKEKRSNLSIPKTIKLPHYWDINDGFNPFKVNKSKQLNTYAHTLARKLKSFTYEPQSSIVYRIPKLSGGTRELNVFQIPDSAISRFIYKSLLKKNVNLFSAYSYAYREDRNAHDAILKIATDWQTRDRVYVAEFDFSKFFDQISHSYLWNILKTRGFLYTEMEEYVLNVFLKSKSAEASSYNISDAGIERCKGIPQGTSISLFLANVACLELDQELERAGVQFARYADDTLIWSNSYEQVIRSYDIISHFSKLIGSPINFEKSEGITLISERNQEEIKSKSQVKFLGYDISLKRVSIGDKSVKHIKDRISYLIYENLLQPLKRGIYNTSRLNLIDWDYIVTLAQIRRYLYGGLDDTKLHRFSVGIIKEIKFRGVMSYYPLVNDEKQLKNLDGWLIHTLTQAMKKRQKIWNSLGRSIPEPCIDWLENITSIKTWTHPTSGIVYDFRIPSFLQINRAMKIGLKRGGVSSVTNPRNIYYSGRFTPKQKH